jgi:hypothetical protein
MAFSRIDIGPRSLVEHDLFGKPVSTHRFKLEGMLFWVMLPACCALPQLTAASTGLQYTPQESGEFPMPEHVALHIAALCALLVIGGTAAILARSERAYNARR